MVKIGNIALGEFPLLLAPMEDVSDPPFRAVCKMNGADLMYTEFISSEGLIRHARKSVQKLDIYDYERPIGIQFFGGDPINGLKHIDVLQMFNDDPDTDGVIMIGEIGGPDEAIAARWAKEHMKKPLVGFIAGVTAPAGKRMGHAGALISGGADTADAKLAVMEECGFTVTRNPSEMARLMKGLL